MDFRCMFCGQELEVEDRCAGQEAPCPACGKTIDIPGLNRPHWHGDPATEKQLAHIREFSVTPFDGITKGDASMLIERLQEETSVNEGRIADFIKNLNMMPLQVQASVKREVRKLGTKPLDDENVTAVIKEAFPDDLAPITEKEFDYGELWEVEDYVTGFLKYRLGVRVDEDTLRHFALLICIEGRMAELAGHCRQLGSALDERELDDAEEEQAIRAWFETRNDVHSFLAKLLGPRVKTR